MLVTGLCRLELRLHLIKLLHGNRLLFQQLLVTLVIFLRIRQSHPYFLDPGIRHQNITLRRMNRRVHRIHPDQRVPVIRLRLCQSQTILGILNHHQRITFTHTLVLFEIYLLDKSLYTGIYRGNMLFHLSIIRVFHPSQMNKTTGYPTNTDNNNKD